MLKIVTHLLLCYMSSTHILLAENMPSLAQQLEAMEQEQVSMLSSFDSIKKKREIEEMKAEKLEEEKTAEEKLEKEEKKRAEILKIEALRVEEARQKSILEEKKLQEQKALEEKNTVLLRKQVETKRIKDIALAKEKTKVEKKLALKKKKAEEEKKRKAKQEADRKKEAQAKLKRKEASKETITYTIESIEDIKPNNSLDIFKALED